VGRVKPSSWTAGSFSPLSEWELYELVDRLADIKKLPHGERGRRRRAVAEEYGVCERTLIRWERKSIHKVCVGRYEAVFAHGRGLPYQVTPWERAA
jgi:hypothetical protein